MPCLLQINFVANIGSTGRIAEQIGAMALSKGWSSYIAYGRGARPSESHTFRVGTSFDFYFHGAQARIFDNSGLASGCATRKFIEVVKEMKPDIIHLHNVHGYYINYKLFFDYLKEAKIPVVWTLHDCWSFTGHCAFFEAIGCEKWKTQCYSCPQTRDYPKSLLFDNSRNNYRLKKRYFNGVDRLTLVPVSHWLEGLLSQSFLSDYPVQVIQNGIDLTLFRPREAHQNQELRQKFGVEGKFLILGVSICWDERKGLADFIELSTQLSDDFSIILVGLSKKQLATLPPQIIGIERTDNQEELAMIYSSADVFINPTYGDTFPTTNLEALASGTPVITYATGGSVESVSEETGFVVEAGDVQGLRNRIEELRARGKGHYAQKCRLRAEQNYNKHERFEDYFKLYQSLGVE